MPHLVFQLLLFMNYPPLWTGKLLGDCDVDISIFWKMNTKTSQYRRSLSEYTCVCKCVYMYAHICVYIHSRIWMCACVSTEREGCVLRSCRRQGRWLFLAGLMVISASKLGHFGFTHSFIHLFKDNLLCSYTEPRDYVISWGYYNKTHKCHRGADSQMRCQTSEEIVSIKCGVMKEVWTGHYDIKIQGALNSTPGEWGARKLQTRLLAEEDISTKSLRISRTHSR